ncbi:MAG TPA: hypothetical protein VGI74_10865 [Streptosporangiaceae bacterium]
MKRITLVFGAVAALVLADGLYMELANYHPGDQNAFFGNQAFVLSDGQVTLISGGLLALATVVMWVIAARRGRRPQAPSGGGAPGQDQPDGRTASRT